MNSFSLLRARPAPQSHCRRGGLNPRLGAAVLSAAAAVGFTACTGGPQAATPATTTPMVVTPTQAAPGIPAARPDEPGLVLPVVTAPKPVPVYPIDMLRARQHGLVYVDCVVDETGHVVATSVRDSSNAAFNAATEDAVRHWTFTPGTKDGVPISMRVLVPVEYVDKEVTTLP